MENKLPEILNAIERIRDTSMRQTLVARTPESGEFGGIAQDADFAFEALKLHLCDISENAAKRNQALQTVDKIMDRLTMLKTEAIRVASRAHSNPAKQNDSGWAFRAPSSIHTLNGPFVAVHAPNYSAAKRLRASKVACMALELMGYTQAEAKSLTQDQTGDARFIVFQAQLRQPNP